jgi:hypothetical protein
MRCIRDDITSQNLNSALFSLTERGVIAKNKVGLRNFYGRKPEPSVGR